MYVEERLVSLFYLYTYKYVKKQAVTYTRAGYVSWIQNTHTHKLCFYLENEFKSANRDLFDRCRPLFLSCTLIAALIKLPSVSVNTKELSKENMVDYKTSTYSQFPIAFSVS